MNPEWPQTPKNEKDIYASWKDVSNETIQSWLSPENLASREKFETHGFEVISSIDGGLDENIEISLVRIKGEGEYPQHIHKDSDAYFVIISGEAQLLSRDSKRPITSGERIDIPRGTPHGFEMSEGGTLEFVSFQSPPIKNSETGEEDFHLFERI